MYRKYYLVYYLVLIVGVLIVYWYSHNLLPRHRTWYVNLTDPSYVMGYTVYEFDGLDVATTTIEQVHRYGAEVVCYVDVGTRESWRADTSLFSQSVIGLADAGWTRENWVDIRSNAVHHIVESRIKEMKSKGCDAIDADNVDAFEYTTGFPLTNNDQLIFNKWVATTAHTFDMKIMLKNDLEQLQQLEPYFDGLIMEDCVINNECDKAKPFIDLHKEVIDIEYVNVSKDINRLCDIAKKENIEIVLMNKDASRIYGSCK